MPLRRDDHRISCAIYCLVRWTNVVERHNTRSLLRAFEGEQIGAARSSDCRTRGTNAANKRPID